MKRFLFASCLTMAAIVPGAADAVDLTLRFTGSFSRGTCQFAASSVDLGTYISTYFDSSPQSPWRTVTVTRSGCTSDITTIHMAFQGTAHPTNANLWRVSNIAGLGVEIQNTAAVAVRPAGTSLDWSPGAATYALNARFSKVSTITSYGAVTVPVVLTFTYN